jgi:hypothetical protein
MKYPAEWETRYTLPTPNGVYYENYGLLAKAAR